MKTTNPIYIRRVNIIKALPPGLSIRQVAVALHLTRGAAPYWCRKFGYPCCDNRKTKSGPRLDANEKEWRRQILDRCKQTMPESQIGALLHLTKQRISQLFAQFGMQPLGAKFNSHRKNTS